MQQMADRADRRSPLPNRTARHRTIPDTLQRDRPARGRPGRAYHARPQHSAYRHRRGGRRSQAKFHPAGISVVVVDPQTGDILSLVSLPNFDPAKPRPASPIDAQWERCATRLYEPGSTLKALTLAAALDNGTITENSWFSCNGHFEIGRKVIHCAHGEVHGSQNAEGILKHSCNIGAALVGLKMGAEKMQETETRFGLLDTARYRPAGPEAGLLLARQDGEHRQPGQDRACRLRTVHHDHAAPCRDGLCGDRERRHPEASRACSPP